AGHDRVLVGDWSAQRLFERTPFEEPELRLRLRIPQGHVRRGIGPVADVERDQPGRDAGTQEDVVERAKVEQVRLIVLALRTAAVDHEDLEARDAGDGR